jgi:hypothetical protein
MNPCSYHLLFAAGVAVCLPACALVAAPHRTAFDETALAPYAAGTATVSGHIVVKAEQDGQFHLGAGSHPTLLPVTAYTREMVERELGDGEILAASDARFKKYVRATTADDHGNFVFRNVPTGEYYLVGLVQWWDADDSQYQWACERIRVTAGQTLQIKLSGNVHHPGKPYVVKWRLE